MQTSGSSAASMLPGPGLQPDVRRVGSRLNRVGSRSAGEAGLSRAASRRVAGGLGLSRAASRRVAGRPGLSRRVSPRVEFSRVESVRPNKFIMENLHGPHLNRSASRMNAALQMNGTGPAEPTGRGQPPGSTAARPGGNDGQSLWAHAKLKVRAHLAEVAAAAAAQPPGSRASHLQQHRTFRTQRGRCCPRVGASFDEKVSSWRFYARQQLGLLLPMIFSLLGSFLMFALRNRILSGLWIQSSLEQMEISAASASLSSSLSPSQSSSSSANADHRPEPEAEPAPQTLLEIFVPSTFQVNYAASLEINEPIAAWLGVTGLAFGLIYAFVFQRAFTRHDKVGRLLHIEIASMNEVISFIHLTDHFEAEIRARLLSNVQKFALDLRIQILSESYDARSKRRKDVFSRIVPDLRALMSAHARSELVEQQEAREDMRAEVQEELEVLESLEEEEKQLLKVASELEKNGMLHMGMEAAAESLGLGEGEDGKDKRLDGQVASDTDMTADKAVARGAAARWMSKLQLKRRSSRPRLKTKKSSTRMMGHRKASFRMMGHQKASFRMTGRLGLTGGLSNEPREGLTRETSTKSTSSTLSAAENIEEAEEAIAGDLAVAEANLEEAQAEMELNKRAFEIELVEGANFDRAILEGILDVLHAVEQAQYERWFWLDKKIPTLLWVLIWVLETAMFFGILLLQTGRGSLDSVLCWVAVGFLATMMYILSDVDRTNIGFMRVGVENLDAMFMIDEASANFEEEDDEDVEGIYEYDENEAEADDVEAKAEADDVGRVGDSHAEPDKKIAKFGLQNDGSYFRTQAECSSMTDKPSTKEEAKAGDSAVLSPRQSRFGWLGKKIWGGEKASSARKKSRRQSSAAALTRVTSTTRSATYKKIGWQAPSKSQFIKSTRTLTVEALRGTSFRASDIQHNAKKKKRLSSSSAGSNKYTVTGGGIE